MFELFDIQISLEPIWLTLKVATVTTAVLLLLGTPAAWWLAHTNSRWRGPIEAVVALPLILPPTVLGFYLLMLLNPQGFITQTLRSIGYEGQLTFSFTGLVIGSICYSLPFAIQPLIHSFEAIPDRILHAAATLRASSIDRFVTIVLPLSRRGFVTAGTLTFAHTVGEFGVVLMIGGNIPGETRVVAIEIFNLVEKLEYAEAHLLSAMMLLFSLTVLMLVYGYHRKTSRVTPC